MTQSIWDQRMVSSVGKHVKAIREAKSPKLSAQGLADRVSELGYPYSRSQLVNLEYGRKKTFEVAELIAIAEALDVAPVEVLFPGLPDGEVEYLPGRTARALDALKHFTGEGKKAWGERDHYLALMRSVDDHRAVASRLKSEAARLDSKDNSSRLAEIESRLESIDQTIDDFRQKLIDAGYTITGPAPKVEPIDLSWMAPLLNESDGDNV